MRLNSFLLVSALLPYAAAQSTLAPPALAYAYDSGSRAIRPVYGTPGAAVLGSPLSLDLVLTNAAIAPQQDYALAVTADDGVRLVRWNAAAGPTAVRITDAVDNPDRIVFSPSGSAALLADTSSGRIQVLTGLPDAPSVQELQAPAISGSLAFAVADDAALIIAGDDQVRILAPGLNASLGLPVVPTAMTFRPNSHDLIAVASSGEVYLAKNADSNPDIRSIYGAGSQTSDPVAVQFSANASSVFVVNRAGILASIDLDTASAATLLCQCSPAGLQPFGRAELFRITDISHNPLLLFDGTPSKNRLWFIPAEAQRSMQ